MTEYCYFCLDRKGQKTPAIRFAAGVHWCDFHWREDSMGAKNKKVNEGYSQRPPSTRRGVRYGSKHDEHMLRIEGGERVRFDLGPASWHYLTLRIRAAMGRRGMKVKQFYDSTMKQGWIELVKQ